MSDGYVAGRLSVNINPETAEALHELAARHGLSVTEIIRIAIGVLDLVDRVQRSGSELQVREGRRVRRLRVPLDRGRGGMQ